MLDSCSSFRSPIVLFTCLSVLFALSGCSDVGPGNPWDPATPVDQQARGAVTGAVVLPPGFGAARLQSASVELRQGEMLIERLALSAVAAATPVHAPFVFEHVAAGDYTLHAEVQGFAIGAVRFELAIGERLELTDLVAVPALSDGGGGIEGTARRAGGGDTGHGGIQIEVADTPALATTTAQGAFRLDLPPGTYTLHFRASGYAPVTRADVVVQAGRHQRLLDDVVLRGEPGRLIGRVALPPGFAMDAGLDGTRVSLWPADAPEDAPPQTEAMVSPAGDFAFEQIDAGRYRMLPSRPGFQAWPTIASLDVGQTLDVGTLPLHEVVAERGQLTGTARLAGVDAHAGIRVTAVDTPVSAVTDGDGSWVIELPPGRYRIRFTHPGYGTEEIDAPAVVAGEQRAVNDIVLTGRPGQLLGSVRIDPRFAGRDLLGRVAMRLSRFDAMGGLTVAAEAGVQPVVDDPERGTYLFDDLPAGNYLVEAMLVGFQPVARAIEIAPGATTQSDALVLSPAPTDARITGRARLDCVGCDHGGIRVEAVGAPYVALTNESGDYRLDVNAGRYTLQFRRAGFGTETTAAFDVEPGALAEQPEVVLSPLPSGVSGRIERLTGAGDVVPAPGATLTLTDDAGAVLAVGQSGDGGAFALDAAGDGAANLSVRMDRHAPSTHGLVLVPGHIVDLGTLRLDLERGPLTGQVSAQTLEAGRAITVIADGDPADPITAGLRHLTATVPGDGAWRLPALPAGQWQVTALAPDHRPAGPTPVRVLPMVGGQLEQALVARRLTVTAPAVVAADAVMLRVDGDADLTFARADPAEPFEALMAGELRVALPMEDGAWPLSPQLANAAAVDADPSNDLFAFISEPQPLTVIRDTAAPDVWTAQAPELTRVRAVVVQLDCRDALAPAQSLIVDIAMNDVPVWQGAYRPQVPLELPASDGIHTISATCTDWAGHVTEPVLMSVRLDRTGPQLLTFDVAGGTPNAVLATPNLPVRVASADGDRVQAAAIGEGGLDCATAEYRWPANGAFVVPVTPGDGPRQLSICLRDRAGNLTGPLPGNPVIIDTASPSAGRLRLADGALFSRTARVDVVVESDEPELTLAVRGDVGPGNWPANAWPAQLVLLGADGPKLVSAQLIDAAGNLSAPFSATIILDRQAPAAGHVRLGDGQAVLHDRIVPISIAETNPDTMRFWEIAPDAPCTAVACEAPGFVPFSPATNLVLSADEGAKRICWQFCDTAGNAAPVAEADVRLGTYLSRPTPGLSQIEPAVMDAFAVDGTVTLTGTGIAGDSVLNIGDFAVPCVSAAPRCQADEDGGCAADGRCAATCATQCTATVPQAVRGSAGVYAVSLRTPTPVAGSGQSSVQFLSIVAPLGRIVDVSPRGLSPVDAAGAPRAFIELTVRGYDLLDNATWRLGPVQGEVLESTPINIPGAPAARPQRAMRLRFAADALPVPIDGRTLMLTVTNPSPGGGTSEAAVGWNPPEIACDPALGCSSRLDRFRVVGATGVRQAYAIEWPASGGVAVRGGEVARWQTAGTGSGLTWDSGATGVTLSPPDGDIDGLMLAGDAVSRPAVSMMQVEVRTGGQLQPLDDAQAIERGASLVDDPHRMQVADINGDGWPDAVCLSALRLDSNASTVTVLTNAAGAAVTQWPQQRVHLGGGAPRALATTDLDGDGYSDVVAVLADAVAVLRGGPDGLEPATILAGVTGVGAVVTDQDADGRGEILVLGVDGAVSRVSPDIHGRMRVTPVGGIPGLDMTDPVVGDVDGDGQADLVVIRRRGADDLILSVLLGGDFSRQIEGPAVSDADHTLALEDLNDDGALDLIVSDPGGGFAVHLGDGRGGWTADLGVSGFAGEDDMRPLAVLDFNADGRPDIVIGPSQQFSRRPARLFAGLGDGRMAPPVDLHPRFDAPPGEAIAIDDFDRDGRLDVLVQNHRVVYLARGAGGQPLDRVDGVDGVPSQQLRHSTLVDLNGDGDLDVLSVVADAQSGRVVRQFGHAGGDFGAPQSQALLGFAVNAPWVASVSPGTRPAAFLIDWVGAVRHVVRVPITEQGDLGAPEIVHTARDIRGVAASPVGADDQSDLITVWDNPPRLGWAAYDPQTDGYGVDTFLDLGARPLFRPSIAAGDLDGDGDADLVVTTQAGIQVIRHDAADVRLVAAGPVLGRCAESVTLADMDADGHLDIITGTHLAGEQGRQCPDGAPSGATIFFGDGQLGFDALHVGGFGQHIGVGDLDGDGWLDVLSATDQPEPRLGVQFGQPGRQFGPLNQRLAPFTPTAVLLGDLDQDGVLDALMPTSQADDPAFMTWLRASPQTVRLRAGGAVAVPVPPGATAQVEWTSQKHRARQVGVHLRFGADEPIRLADLRVELEAPDGRVIPLALPPIEGRWLPVHLSDVGLAGHYQAGAWRIGVQNIAGTALRLEHAELIINGGWVAPIE